jgi:hypothetical protein
MLGLNGDGSGLMSFPVADLTFFPRQGRNDKLAASTIFPVIIPTRTNTDSLCSVLCQASRSRNVSQTKEVHGRDNLGHAAAGRSRMTLFGITRVLVFTAREAAGASASGFPCALMNSGGHRRCITRAIPAARMRACGLLSLRAKRSNPEHRRCDSLDCFVATLLAMTMAV